MNDGAVVKFPTIQGGSLGMCKSLLRNALMCFRGLRWFYSLAPSFGGFLLSCLCRCEAYHPVAGQFAAK